METDDDKDRRRKYIAELVARGGVQIDPDDPSFELIVLNRLILEDQKTEIETLFARFLLAERDILKKLDAVPEVIASQIAPELGAAAAAVAEAKRTIGALADAQRVDFGNFTMAERAAFRDAMKSAAGDIAGEAMGQASRALQSAAEAHTFAVNAQRRAGVRIALVAGVVGLLVGVIGLAGGYFFFGAEMAERAKYGKAVWSVWDQLDKKTKGMIQSAL